MLRLLLFGGILLLPQEMAAVTSKESSVPTDRPIDLNYNNVPLKRVLHNIEKATGYKMIYAVDDVKEFGVTSSGKAANIKEALDIILAGKPLTFNVKKEYVYIVRKNTARANKPAATSLVTKNSILIQGTVVDQAGETLPGVAINIDELEWGTVSDANGGFIFEMEANLPKTLRFSYVGKKTITKSYDCRRDFVAQRIVMDDDIEEIGEVVVVGLLNRRAESFTGSATTFKGEELRAVGNQNIIRSLAALDPSFQIVEDLSAGSDPNRTPTVQVRGATSLNLQSSYEGNPNQPLFVLDGFETDIEKMYDMDMSRVASITILKDAAAKAIYGSKAGNGVVVVETIRPQEGQLKVYYTGDINFESPDLSGYNLMNAQEKLDFEVSRGMYKSHSVAEAHTMDLRLKANRDNILRGVDTDWLSQPTRTGIGNKHSLTVEGGDSRMRYQAGVSFNNVQGAMKGSNRNTLNLHTTLTYSYKGLRFRNMLQYTSNWADNSPYGSFSEYAVLNPYWTPYDENGNYTRILGYGENDRIIYNPLYNATLNTKSSSSYSEVNDNFSIEWTINRNFRATGNFSYTQRRQESDLFYPASHTMFAEYDVNGLTDRKGRYTKGHGTSQTLAANVGINFNKEWGSHLLFANATWNMRQDTYKTDSYTAEGFGNDQMDNIGFATQYLKDSAPSSTDNKVREIGIIGVVNYAFDSRYLFDFSVRGTGSSIYGSDNRWGCFWSAGLGWNLHNEHFMKDVEWLSIFKLRGSTGFTGTQNFNPFQARARYAYGDVIYNGRFGALLQGLPNSALQWQKVRDTNIGVDIAIKQIVNLKFDYYTQKTSNMLSDITTVPSMGFSTYKANLGDIKNKGYDLTLSVTPWRNSRQRGWLTFTVSALHNDNKIVKIYDLFKDHNDRETAAKDSPVYDLNKQPTAEDYNKDRLAKTTPSTLYYEGCSMTAIWGVPSLGVDPMTGRRMYVDKNGNITYNWNSADQVIIGDTNPKLQGSVGINAGWKGFTFGVSCGYRLGGDIYNSVLVNKVENVTGYQNLDRRIMDSWQNVGDISPYKELEVDNSQNLNYTKPNSSFVEKNNEFYCNTLSVGYEVINYAPFRSIGLDRLKLTFYANQLFHWSSVKIERGTEYPFARNYSISLQATF